MSGEPLDPRTFRHVLGQFCTGITVITTLHDGKPVGFACQSFAALSLEPPLVLFCPTKVSRSWQAIEASGITVETSVVEAHSVWRGILDAATAMEADIVIMGSHGRHGIEKLLGSVAQRVLSHAHVPVMVVRD